MTVEMGCLIGKTGAVCVCRSFDVEEVGGGTFSD